MREAQALLRRAGRTDFIMVAERWEQVTLHDELLRGKESIDLQLIAIKTMDCGSRALAVGLPASVNAGRVGVLRLKVKQERVPEPPRDHMP